MPYNLNFNQEKPDAELFNRTAETVAKSLHESAGASGKNKTTQIRRFYDELVGWQERIGNDDSKFKELEAFIKMLNAKVAYATGRNLVDNTFKEWFRECIAATTSATALKHFRLHFEAVLGFLKALRG